MTSDLGVGDDVEHVEENIDNAERVEANIDNAERVEENLATPSTSPMQPSTNEHMAPPAEEPVSPLDNLRHYIDQDEFFRLLQND